MTESGLIAFFGGTGGLALAWPGVYQLIFEYELTGKEREDAERELEGIARGVTKSWDYGFVIVRPSPEHAPEID